MQHLSDLCLNGNLANQFKPSDCNHVFPVWKFVLAAFGMVSDTLDHPLEMFLGL